MGVKRLRRRCDLRQSGTALTAHTLGCVLGAPIEADRGRARARTHESRSMSTLPAPKSSITTERTDHARIVFIDDDSAICGLVQKYLTHKGHTVETLPDGKNLLRALAAPVDVLLLDMSLPGENGLSLLERAVRERPGLTVIMLTASSDVELVVECMKRGAFDYLTKPIDLQRLSAVLTNALQHTRLRQQAEGMQAARNDNGPPLLSASVAMMEVISLVERVATARVPVLIYGPEGAGKSLVARRIHARSRRKDGPIIVVRCAGESADALEQALFQPSTTKIGSSNSGPNSPAPASSNGVYGANTSSGNSGPNAVSRSSFDQFDLVPGPKLVEARGGTLVLENVDALSHDMQGKLLRLLQATQMDRLSTGTEVDIRIIATTSKHLSTEVSQGNFRADLFYRLNVFSITVPPLKDRKEDISALAQFSLARFAASEQRSPPELPPDVLDAMLSYDWPGNVRELNTAMEKAAILCSNNVITIKDLPEQIQRGPEVPVEPVAVVEDSELQPVRPLQEMERDLMVAALRETGGNVSEAARRLGIGRATFYRRAQRHGLTRDEGFLG